jgi:hypothetical protein
MRHGTVLYAEGPQGARETYLVVSQSAVLLHRLRHTPPWRVVTLVPVFLPGPLPNGTAFRRDKSYPRNEAWYLNELGECVMAADLGRLTSVDLDARTGLNLDERFLPAVGESRDAILSPSLLRHLGEDLCDYLGCNG